ncbi:Enterobactin exporter EntS [Pigmentiphaga humi]|uniref:Enterobactin exporter EntS n=1 Tax=Pigmentiphaga humi TaxID=2478468 RepID=A0A3P4B934_9BURK|nr:MFS transporter [Pigmentiphaga humi]VCU72481.1 Enterobactin exporter EntS [Pigmentiphaga humi]
MSSASDATTGQAPVVSVARHPPFILFWFGRVMSTLSFQMLSVAVGWQVYEITGSAFDLGLVGLAQFIPMVLLTFVVGQVADRYDRRAIASICMIVEALAAGALALGTYQGWLTRELILALVAIGGAGRAFESPTMAALVQGVVPRELIPQAAAWTTSATQTAQILGPALGGLLYGFGSMTAYVVACVFFSVGGVLVALIRAERVVSTREPATLKTMFSGLSFIRSRPIILGTLSLDLFAVLLGGATALLPIYARDILETGPWGLGLLRTSPAVGALTMSVVLAHFPIRHHVGRALFASLVVFGLATVVFGLSTHLLVSMAALFVLGASDVISVVIRFTLVQLQTPPEMLGRVSAVNSLFIGTSNQLGEFESGVTAALFGVVPAVLIGGAGTIAIALLWMVLFPQLRKLKSLEG